MNIVDLLELVTFMGCNAPLHKWIYYGFRSFHRLSVVSLHLTQKLIINQ